jgi:hypothetical protein
MFTYQYGYTFNLGLNLRCVKFQAENVARTNHDVPAFQRGCLRPPLSKSVKCYVIELLNQQLADLLDLGGLANS